MRLNTSYHSLEDILKAPKLSPLPLTVIPNYMGINVITIRGVSLTRREDNQLISFTIHFQPDDKENI